MIDAGIPYIEYLEITAEKVEIHKLLVPHTRPLLSNTYGVRHHFRLMCVNSSQKIEASDSLCPLHVHFPGAEPFTLSHGHLMILLSNCAYR